MFPGHCLDTTNVSKPLFGYYDCIGHCLDTENPGHCLDTTNVSRTLFEHFNANYYLSNQIIINLCLHESLFLNCFIT